jgi:hypothetical protein
MGSGQGRDGRQAGEEDEHPGYGKYAAGDWKEPCAFASMAKRRVQPRMAMPSAFQFAGMDLMKHHEGILL